jgi:hypothetical protein
MYNIADNCLSSEDFSLLKNALLGAEFPWYLNSSKVFKNSVVEDRFNYQFTHTFYHNYSGSSNWMSVIAPLISIINPSAIVRIKANLVPVTDKIILYDYHIDEPNFEGETAIFYVNNNNGYTQFTDGQQVSSVENRLLTFNSNMLHTGSSCTDQKVRCVINLNYYKQNKLR